MKTIRQSQFNTNSSSAHSITISHQESLLTSIKPDEEGDIVLNGGQFGWEWEKYNDALTKANYCAIAIKAKYISFENVFVELLKEQTGAENIVFNFSIDNFDHKNYSYIDHQSLDDDNKSCDKLFGKDFSIEKLRNFIFNSNSWLFTGNDNDIAPANFYDIGKTFTHEVKLDGVSTTYKICFEDLDNDEKLDEILRTLWREHNNNEHYNYAYIEESFTIPFGNNSLNFIDKPKKIINVVIQKPQYTNDKERRFVCWKIVKTKQIPWQVNKLKNPITI